MTCNVIQRHFPSPLNKHLKHHKLHQHLFFIYLIPNLPSVIAVADLVKLLNVMWSVPPFEPLHLHISTFLHHMAKKVRWCSYICSSLSLCLSLILLWLVSISVTWQRRVLDHGSDCIWAPAACQKQSWAAECIQPDWSGGEEVIVEL